jgi:hypothetical protein
MDHLETQLAPPLAGGGSGRVDEETLLVARVGSVEHVAHDPAGTVVKDRQPARTLVPPAPREFVHLVARIGAEQLGQLPLVGG